MFKKINPANNDLLLNADENTLGLLSLIANKEICIGNAPLIGKYIIVDKKTVAQNEPKHPDLDFAYEKKETGEIIRIYIGSSYHGPLLQWCSDGWRNCYGHGNHGKNGSSGGSWGSSGKNVYPTIKECLKNRDYKTGEIIHHKSRLTEGPALIEALNEIAEKE